VIGLSEFTEEDKKRLENCVTSEELAEVLSQIEFNIKNSTEIIDEKL